MASCLCRQISWNTAVRTQWTYSIKILKTTKTGAMRPFGSKSFATVDNAVRLVKTCWSVGNSIVLKPNESVAGCQAIPNALILSSAFNSTDIFVSRSAYGISSNTSFALLAHFFSSKPPHFITAQRSRYNCCADSMSSTPERTSSTYALILSTLATSGKFDFSSSANWLIERMARYGSGETCRKQHVA